MTRGTTRTGHEDTPWDPTPDAHWAQAVDTWEWAQLNGRWIKQGHCPTCQGPMFVELGLTGLKEAADQEVYAECNCGFKHGDHEGGCGRAAMIGGPS